MACPLGTSQPLAAAAFDALVALYDRLPVGSSVAWSRESSPCLWQGVQCRDRASGGVGLEAIVCVPLRGRRGVRAGRVRALNALPLLCRGVRAVAFSAL